MIPGYDDYMAREDGRVASIYNGGRELTPTPIKGKKFLTVSLPKHACPGKYVTRYVHHIILETFVGPRPDNHYAAHRNGDVSDNRLVNLEWREHRARPAEPSPSSSTSPE